MSRPFRPVLPLVFSMLALAVGCGPFGYLKKVAKEANRAVADAKAVGAEEYAPYEYWGAVTYLEQSKVMMAYSEYERSFDYGERAKDLAGEAKKKTQMREAGETVVTGDAAPTGDEGTVTPGTEATPTPSPAQGPASGASPPGGEPASTDPVQPSQSVTSGTGVYTATSVGGDR